MTSCPACTGPMAERVTSWTARCGSCGHWTADLRPHLEAGQGNMPVVEGDEPIGFLEPVRRANFNRILRQVRDLGVDGPLLDIGCGSGFFLKVAAEQGFAAQGIEPKAEMAHAATQQGCHVRHGLFPDALDAGETFAAIFFNDVLEHIADPGAVLDACHDHLSDDGLLVINVPSAHGLFYRLATLLRRAGVQGPFNRLWQTMFYTPHLHYFTPHSLVTMAARHGFTPAAPVARLESVSLSGLRARVAADGSLGPLGRLTTLVGTAALVPAAAVLPADAMVGMFRRTERA